MMSEPSLTEVSVGGVLIAPIVVYMLVAIPLFVVLRTVLGRTGLLRRLWHPALVELALYVCIVSLLVLFV